MPTIFCISRQYDNFNQRIISINELGIETRYNYNSKGLVEKITATYKKADQTVTRYRYDDNGNRISLIICDGDTPIATEYIFDEKNNLTSIHDTLGGVRSFDYDFMGNVVKETDPVGLRSCMTYDLHGNLISVTAHDDQKARYSYDAAHRRISLSKDS